MGLFNILDPVFAAIFNPLVSIGHFWAILLLAFLVTLMITLFYKFFTDQKEMKSLKDQQKKLSAEMKQYRKDPSKAMKIQKQLMEINTKYMKHSFKSTFYTIIPIIIIFGWANAHLANFPLVVDEEFNVTANFEKDVFGDVMLEVPEGLEILSDSTKTIENKLATWTLKGKAGDYMLAYKLGENYIQTKRIIIGDPIEYAQSMKRKSSFFEKIFLIVYSAPEGYMQSTSPFTRITIQQRPVKPMGNLSIFGWHPGWLGTYILLSIIFSMALRKAFKVY
ncbi:EMC3/TMCO1 family protein [Nanoarchaeota archaeon]